LDESWRQQPGTPAYGQDLEAAALRRALAEADRSRIAEYRAEQEDSIKMSVSMRITDYMRSHFLTARTAARRMVEKRSGVILNHRRNDR
jgi:hypothetical protein